MGQQQLLLVILVSILVGIATIVALQVTGSQLEKSNKTNARQDVLSIATSSNGYYRKPDFVGGGGNSYKGITFKEITFPKDGISNDGLKTYNANGTYVINSRSDHQFTVKAYPSSDEKYDSKNPLNSTNGEALTAVITPDTVKWQ